MANGMADRSARACRSDPWEKAFLKSLPTFHGPGEHEGVVP
jgi:hypothetical protein